MPSAAEAGFALIRFLVKCCTLLYGKQGNGARDYNSAQNDRRLASKVLCTKRVGYCQFLGGAYSSSSICWVHCELFVGEFKLLYLYFKVVYIFY